MPFKIRVQNIASFQDSDQFEINPGLNAFIGINNSGKTALLWALSMLGCAMKEEASAWAMTLTEKMEGYRRSNTNPAIQVEFSLPSPDRDQIISELCKLSGNPTFPRYSESQETVEFNLRFNRSRQVNFIAPVNMHYNSEGSRKSTNILNKTGSDPFYVVNHPFDGPRPNTWSPSKFDLDQRGVEDGAVHFRFRNPDEAVAKCWPSIFNSVFLLGAGREFIPRYSTKIGSTDLKPNAENLTQVLRTANQSTRSFRDSRKAFQRIEEDLRSVFPEVRELRVEGIEQPGQQEDQSEIVLDLTSGQTVSLSNSGSGVAQIATLLTAAHLKTTASLFLIDEPHAYLHPAAERALVHILEGLSKEREHVFCLASHSSIVSSRCKGSLFAVINRENDSKVACLKDTIEILDVLGITNYDLFTYDKVLFVEGESDVSVFGLVIDAFDNSHLSERIKLVGLDGDGHLKSKGAPFFKRLLTDSFAAKARVPVGFLIDSGARSEQEKQDLQKVLHTPPRSVLRLLKQNELEDYLLDPKSITAMLARELKLTGAREAPDLLAEITKIVAEAKEKGSKVLQQCFTNAIPGRPYSKKKDSPALAAEILASNRSFLRPLYDEIQLTITEIGKAVANAASVT
jgi:hypothetical protein